MKNQENKVAESANTAMIAAIGGGLPAAMEDFYDAPTGFETVDNADIATPSLAIAQAMSKVAKAGQVKAGMIYNTITGEQYPAGVTLIPVAFIKTYVEWVPLELGGGFVAEHKPNSAFVMSLTGGNKVFSKIETPDGVTKDVNGRKQHQPTELVETITGYFLHVPDGETIPQPVVMRFWSTKFKAYGKLLGMAQSRKFTDSTGNIRQVPMYAYAYRLESEIQQTKQGEIHGYAVKFANGEPEASRVSKAVFSMAVQFAKAVYSGEVVAVSPEYDMGNIVSEQVDGGFTHDTPAANHAEKF